MPPKKFKPKKKRDRKAEALARLKNRWEQDHENEVWEPENEPVITPMLKAVEGGIPAVLEALRAYDNDDAQSFIACYDGLTASDRKAISTETIAFVCGVGSIHLAGAITEALLSYGQTQTKMLLGSSMHKVMKATIKAATDEVPITAYNAETGMQEVVGKTNGDIKAMEMFHKMSGMMPLPKGAQIAIQNNYAPEKEQDKPAGGAWRDSGERLREFHDLTEPKRLPSPESKPILIGGHVDRMQQETVEILRGE